jgi:hypothetical protein
VTSADAKKVIDEVFPSSSALAIVVVGNAGAHPRRPAQVRTDHGDEARRSDVCAGAHGVTRSRAECDSLHICDKPRAQTRPLRS